MTLGEGADARLYALVQRRWPYCGPGRLGTKLLVLQPTPYCNINCRYCYLPNRNVASRMSMATLRHAVNAVQASGLNQSGMSVVWHGGEPFSLPCSYYADAFKLVRSLQTDTAALRLAVQTNAIGITDELCKLLIKYSVSVGVSLDGTKEIHDSNRKTRSGSGSYELTLRGLRRLQDHGLDPTVICVITRNSLGDAKSFIEFFRHLEISRLCLNFEEIEAANRDSTLVTEEAEEELRCFLEGLYRCYLACPRPAIREFENIENIAFEPLTYINTQAFPFDIISVAWDGGFSTFSPELLGWNDPQLGSFILGNVNDGSIADVLNPDTFDRLWSLVADGVRDCQSSCELFSLCGGGAPSNKLAETGNLAATESLSCRIRVKLVAKIMHDVLKNQSQVENLL